MRKVLTECLKDLNSSKKKQTPNVTKVTSKQLEDWMCQSPDLDVKRMVALYKGDGIRRLSKGWFELNDSPFFVAKQMSTWAGPN